MMTLGDAVVFLIACAFTIGAISQLEKVEYDEFGERKVDNSMAGLLFGCAVGIVFFHALA